MCLAFSEQRHTEGTDETLYTWSYKLTEARFKPNERNQRDVGTKVKVVVLGALSPPLFCLHPVSRTATVTVLLLYNRAQALKRASSAPSSYSPWSFLCVFAWRRLWLLSYRLLR